MKLSKDIKIRLLEMGYESLRDYCKERGVDYQMARLLLVGVLTGKRKNRKAKKIKQVLIKDFGREIFSNT